MHILFACYFSDCCSKAHYCSVVDGWAPLTQQRRQLEHTTQQLVLFVVLLPGVISLWKKVKNVRHLHPYPIVSITLIFVVVDHVSVSKMHQHLLVQADQLHARCKCDIYVFGTDACMTQCANM